MAIDRNEIIRRAEANSVYQWGRKRATRDVERIGTAKDAWSMQQNIALRLAKGQIPIRHSPNANIADDQLAEHLLAATTVSWSREIFDVATGSHFGDVAYHPPDREVSPSFWLLDSFATTSAFPIFALALIPDPPGRTIVIPIGRDQAGLVPIAVHYGATREQHREYWTKFANRMGAQALISTADLCFRALVLGTAFLESPYIPKERETVGKPSRKDSIATRRNAQPHEVTVVNLRRAMAANEESDVGEYTTESERRSRSHRWLVSGHFRNQAYGPGHSRRKVIWVPAHMRGPEDAPLKKTVYRAIR
jgi:hypothetical protein